MIEIEIRINKKLANLIILKKNKYIIHGQGQGLLKCN